MKGDLWKLGPTRKNEKSDWDSCPYDAERPNTAVGYVPETEKSKCAGPGPRPIEPDLERVNALTNAILLAIEHAECVDMTWVNELYDICRLHNMFSVPKRTVIHGADGTTFTL